MIQRQMLKNMHYIFVHVQEQELKHFTCQIQETMTTMKMKNMITKSLRLIINQCHLDKHFVC